MNFRNVRFYRITDTKALRNALTEQSLQAYLFQPCKPHQFESNGFVPTDEVLDTLMLNVGKTLTLVSVMRQSRLLPNAVINKEVSRRAHAIEEREGRSIFRKERTALKEEVIHALLPQAFTRDHKIWVWFDWKRELLCIANASSTQADETLNLLREALGSVTVAFPATVQVFGHTIAGKLKANEAFAGDYGTSIKLNYGDKQRVSVKGQALPSDEVLKHLENPMMVDEIELDFTDQLSAIATSDLALKSIKFAAHIGQQLEEYEDPQAHNQASLLLYSAALGDVFLNIVNALGGYQEC